MHVMQIVELRLVHNAGDYITHSAYLRVDNWIRGIIDPTKTFKAVVAKDMASAHLKCSEQIHDAVKAVWPIIGSELFEYRVADQEVIDGKFWMGPYNQRGIWFKVQFED